MECISNVSDIWIRPRLSSQEAFKLLHAKAKIQPVVAFSKSKKEQLRIQIISDNICLHWGALLVMTFVHQFGNSSDRFSIEGYSNHPMIYKLHAQSNITTRLTKMHL